MTELQHHGILGMKWGIRRFQNPDGTLTAEGKERYGGDVRIAGGMAVKKQFKNRQKSINSNPKNRELKQKYNELREDLHNEVNKLQKTDPFYSKYKEVESELDELYREAVDELDGDNDNVYYKKLLSTIDSTETLSKQLYDYYAENERKIVNEYLDKFASTTLNDLGYENTKEARDWLKQKSWFEKGLKLGYKIPTNAKEEILWNVIAGAYNTANDIQKAKAKKAGDI